MRIDFVTKDDLNEFRLVLLTDLTRLLKRADPAQPWLKSYEVRNLLKISAGTLHRLRSKGILPYLVVARWMISSPVRESRLPCARPFARSRKHAIQAASIKLPRSPTELES